MFNLYYAGVVFAAPAGMSLNDVKTLVEKELAEIDRINGATVQSLDLIHFNYINLENVVAGKAEITS